MKVYYDKEILTKEERFFILGIDVEEEDIDKEFVVYEGDELFNGYPYIEDNILRQATLEECVKLGYVTLEDGQYVNNDEIVTIAKDVSLIKPKWNGKSWIETATKKELEVAELARLDKELLNCRKCLLDLEIEIIALERIGLSPTEDFVELKQELLLKHATLSENIAFKLNK